MPDDDVICPLCGNKSRKDASKCPVCGTELHKARQRKVRERILRTKPSGELLRKDLPKLELLKTKLHCPFCAMELAGGEAKCPRCSVPLSSAPAVPPMKAKEEMLECPECSKFAPVGAKKCPNCGVNFQEEPSRAPTPPVPEEIPPPPEPSQVSEKPPEKPSGPEPEPAPEPAPAPEPEPEPVAEPVPIHVPEPEPEATREVVTAVVAPASQASEGFINGKGAASDRGFVNGTGLVNGTGMTNGTRAELKVSQNVARERSLLTRWQFLAVLVALVIIIPTFVYLSYYSAPEGLMIDGEFDDWRGVDKFGAYTSSGSSSIDIDEWAVQTKDSSLYMYLKVAGTLMTTTAVESFFLFVDSDDNAYTGYSISGMGADYLLQLDGWDGEIKSTALYAYDLSSDYDWSGWKYVQALDAGRGSSELEAKASFSAVLGSDARYMLVSQDQIARSSASYPVPSSGGVLVVRQDPGPAVAQPLDSVPAASSVGFMTLRFTCEGEGGEVTSVTPFVVGATLAWSFEEFSISPGETRTEEVIIDMSAASPGDMVSAYLTRGNIQSSFAEVMVIGDGVRAYVSSPPGEITIDGAFGDWAGLVASDNDPVSIPNPDIDITGVAAVNASDASYFFVGVAGEMCAGSLIPVIVSKPTSGGGGGGIVVPTRMTGEDVLTVYIDSDMSASTGFPYAIPSKTVGADFKVEVKGLYGRVESKALLQYAGGVWNLVVGAIPAVAKDVQRLELAIGAAYIDGSSSIDFIVETTDWLQHNDQATALPIGVRSSGVVSVSAINPMGWQVEDPTSSALATAMSYQRKLFYDGTNFWSFYWNGANTVYRYSADYGVTWSTISVAFKTAGVNEVSIWYDTTNRIVYAVGDTSTPSRDVVVQRGVVDPALRTISWAASDSTARTSLNAEAGKNAFICKDATGRLWVLSANLTNPAGPSYDLSAFQTSAADDITAWIHSGNMLDLDITQSTLKGVIVPAGAGNSVWAVYTYEGNVASRKHTGIWSTQTNIYTLVPPANPDSSIYAPPSAVVDASGVIHVVYGDGHQQTGVSKPFIYYANNTGSSWSAPYRLDSVQNSLGNKYPTISIDSSTGTVYALWVQTDTGAVARTIMCKKKVGSTWQDITIGGQTTDPKQYLTSTYSAPAEHLICWQWTQNTSAPIQVIFDKIPEFDTALMPAFFLMVVVVVLAGRSRRKAPR